MVRCRIALVALVALVLVPGCAREEPRPAEPPAAVAQDTGSFVARGNEPFWSVSVTAAGIVFSEPDLPDGVRGPYVPPVRRDEILVFRTVLSDSAATPLELALEHKPCNDSMSDREYAYAAVARVGDRVLQGCAERGSAGATNLDRKENLPAKLGPGQAVTLRGELGTGAECPMLIVQPERRFSLGGDLGRFKTGDRVCVHGTVAEMSICMAGEANIIITSIAPEDSCR